MVKPPKALPVTYCTIEFIPNTKDMISIINPQIVTICIGAEENDVIFNIAYLTNAFVDHLDSPASLSATLNGTCIVLNPTHEDKALKKEFLSY